MSSEVAIEVDRLSKCFHIYEKPHHRLMQMLSRGRGRFYREFWALRDVSFSVRRGETVGIVGCNGSGKSTLLQLVCGTLNPSAGTVRANGRIAALLELGSGFNPDFSGRENVYLNAAILGISGEEIERRFDAIAAFADIGNFLDEPVKTYSSGMALRLAFSVATNVDPEILVIDEALAVGDERFQRKCFARLDAIKKQGATILFVSHSGASIIEHCDRAVLLDAGQLLRSGTPKHIIGRYQRLLYAPPDKRDAIKEFIRHEPDVPDADLSGAPEDPVNAGVVISAMSRKSSVEHGYFDPNLKPQSTVAYDPKGAIIDAPGILDAAGRPVNCLVQGGTYRYVYRVRFTSGCVSVRFGMLIKTVSGFELGGGVSAASPAEIIEYVAEGTQAQVEFSFRCSLAPGVYFLNAGVLGMPEQDAVYLHRILDACMFRVLPVDETYSTSLVDFECRPSVTIVEKAKAAVALQE